MLNMKKFNLNCLLLLLTLQSSFGKVIETFGKETLEDGPFGGSGGTPWTDGGEVHLNGLISAFYLRAGSEVEMIQVGYKAQNMI